MNEISERITEEQASELMATILHKLGVPCPSPNMGMELLRICEAIDRITADIDNASMRALPMLKDYSETLRSLALQWAYQQKLLIENMETLVKGGAA